MLSHQPLAKVVGGGNSTGGFPCNESGSTGPTGGSGNSNIGSAVDPQARNPLLCFVCDNYYSEPCLLMCYHTFCAKCLLGKEVDRKVVCPLCGQQTPLKDGQTQPPSDLLMRQLIEMANAENPPCANCDKRDKCSMYFCVTCGQALCTNCRENTHRAKMFSTHEVVHMSKCSKESYRKQCTTHGEQHVMFSNSQRTMLCDNCIHDLPGETKLHCVDIDTAYNQGCKKLERAVQAIHGMQSSVREGLLLFSNLLEELRRNVETEKVTINSFCQGMQQAIAKTHAAMMMEVQRQYETKERIFHGQLANLGSMLPLLQLHLMLAQTFTFTANKYQFLDLAYPMMDRLNAVTQLSAPLSRPVQSGQIRTNFRAEFAHALEPWVGKVQVIDASHIRSGTGLYESQSQQHQHHVQQQQQPQQQHQPQQQLQQQHQIQHQHQHPQLQQQHSQSQQQQFPMPHSTPSRRQQSALRVKAMEGEGPFSNHCRSFDGQIKDLSSQLGGVKERLGELHRDVTLLRRAHTPPLTMRYEAVTRDCNALEQALECRQVELERLQGVFHALWEEQLCRVSVEREIFQAQVTDVVSLAGEVKNLANAARQLEPYVVALSAAERIAMSQMQHQPQQQQNSQQPQQQQQQSHQKPSAEQAAHLQSLLDHITMLHADVRFRAEGESGKGECRVHPVASPGHASATSTNSLQDKLLYLKLDSKSKSSRTKPTRDRDRSEQRENRDAKDQQALQAMLEPGYGTAGGRESKRGSVLSQLMGKVRTKEDRKKSPEQEHSKTPTRERGKSENRGENSRSKTSLSEDNKVKSKSSCDGLLPSSSTCKVASLYHSLSGKVQGSSTCSILTAVGVDDEHQQHRRHLPPPPPPQRRPTTQITTLNRMNDSSPIDIPDGTVKRRSRLSRPSSAGDKDDGDYPVPRKSKSVGSPIDTNSSHMVRAKVHREPLGSQPTSPRRHRSTDSALRQIRLYPASDTEDSVFKQSSCESLANLSDIGLSGDHRKTLIVVVGSKSKRLMQKQRSWETFPPKRRDGHRGRFCHDPEAFRNGQMRSPIGSTMSHIGPTLKKADSFEGHEEAVRTLVATVQEARHQQQQHQHQQQQQHQHQQQQHQQQQQQQQQNQHHHQRKHSGPKASTPGSGSN